MPDFVVVLILMIDLANAFLFPFVKLIVLLHSFAIHGD